MLGLVYTIAAGLGLGCGQKMAGGGVGALVEAFRILLNLLDGFAVLRKAGVGLVEQEKVIVPFTEGFLGALVAGGEGGGGFGGVDAGLCEVACGFRRFAEGVKILVVPRVEAADVFGEPALGDGDELRAAELEIERGAEVGFEVFEPEVNFFLLLVEAFDEFALVFLALCGKVFAETFVVRSALVRCQEIVLDVGVTHGTCCTAQFAKRTLQRFGLLVDSGDAGGEDEQFEGGFDSPRGGTQMMDAPGRGFFDAGGDGCLERQGLAEKDGNRLRHGFTFGYRCVAGPEGRHYAMGKVARNRRGEWVFSER